MRKWWMWIDLFVIGIIGHFLVQDYVEGSWFWFAWDLALLALMLGILRRDVRRAKEAP